MNVDLADTAWDLYDKAINTFPLSSHSKQPSKGFEWKPLTERQVTEDEIRQWFCSDVQRNIALLCGAISGVVAIDADTRENARALFGVLPRTAAMQRTPNGGHFLYRLPKGLEVPPAVKTEIRGVTADVRGTASYIVISPSLHPSGTQYEWVNWPWNLKDVPECDPEWFEGNGGKRPLSRDRVQSVDAYLARVESIQGKNGSAGLVRAAAVCRDSGLSEAEAAMKLARWNQGPTVKPPWPEEEIARAITRTYARSA